MCQAQLIPCYLPTVGTVTESHFAQRRNPQVRVHGLRTDASLSGEFARDLPFSQQRNPSDQRFSFLHTLALRQPRQFLLDTGDRFHCSDFRWGENGVFERAHQRTHFGRHQQVGA